MNWVVIIFLLVLYLAFIIYLIIKLIDIFRNNKKYDTIKGWDKYRKSFWYEKDSDYYRLSSKNYWAPIITQIPMLGITIGLYYLLSILVQRYLFAPDNALVVFRTDSYYISFLGLIFFASLFCFWICYNSKAPVLIAATRVAFNSETRGGDWKKLIVSLLIVTFISFPLCILSIDNYGYVTEQKISYNPLFSIGEQDYPYDEIVEVTTSFSASNDNEEFYFSYVITTKEGPSLDVATAGSSGILLVNHFLMTEDISISKGVIDRDIYETMIERCSMETIQMVNECYQVS